MMIESKENMKKTYANIDSIITFGNPNSSIRIRWAKGPPAPCMPSKRIEKSGCLANSLMSSKLKLSFSTFTYSVKGSMIVTAEVGDREKVVPAGALISISGDPCTVLKLDISKLRS